MENLMNLRWWSACIGVLVGEFVNANIKVSHLRP